MAADAHLNLDAGEDIAPKYGMDTMGEARFVRDRLGAERIGLSAYKVKPGARPGFGHHHGTMEEMYVVLSGSGRFKVDDDIVEVGPRDVLYCRPEAMREWEAGPDGLELLAFGAHAEGDDESHMEPGWWKG
jgi:mannose-6-phosphate isomerase-like protein (cupin superfamily)